MTLDDRRAGGSHDAAAQDGHPDAMQLAEYAEGLLAPDQRAVVERHLAVCADCRDLVIDAAAYAAEQRDATAQVPAPAPAPTVVPFRRRKVVIAITAGLAAAAAILLTVQLTQGPSVSTSLDALIAAADQESTRPLEGRLAGFRYAAAPTVTRGAGDVSIAPDLRIAAATLEKAAAGHDDAASLAATGIAHAVAGELDAAVASLEDAIRREPDHAQHQSDLSAVYLARGRRDAKVADYDAALSAANHALAIDGSLPNACFNQALALEALTRRDDARAAWERCLALEKDGAWADEIRTRLAQRAP